MPAAAGRSERKNILQTYCGALVFSALPPPKCWGAPWYCRLGISLRVLQEFVLPVTTSVTSMGSQEDAEERQTGIPHPPAPPAWGGPKLWVKRWKGVLKVGRDFIILTPSFDMDKPSMRRPDPSPTTLIPPFLEFTLLLHRPRHVQDIPNSTHSTPYPFRLALPPSKARLCLEI